MTNLKNKKTLISQIILAIVLLILLFLVLFPFWLMLVKSFKSFMQEVESPLTLTFPLAWENYRVAWEQIGGSILNSFFVSGMEALITLFLSAVGAYGFSRYRFRFKNLLYSCFLALMMIPGVLTLTTKYVMVATTFGMYGSFLGVILPQAAGLVPFGILLLRGFFDGLPKDLFDAADLDGANSVRQFFSVCLPLSTPILMTLVLMNFMTSWNDYLWPMTVLENVEYMTVYQRDDERRIQNVTLGVRHGIIGRRGISLRVQPERAEQHQGRARGDQVLSADGQAAEMVSLSVELEIQPHQRGI